MEKKETVLVTGGTGFVAKQIILQLLQKGYRVRATLRSLKHTDKVLSTLVNNGMTTSDELSFIETELTSDDNWFEAMDGCKYVLSVASPVFFEVPKDEHEALRPAVEGILRVLKFAQLAGVKRVVMTSNFGAVGFSQTDKQRETKESDWTDPNTKGLSTYEKSKTLAEMAAWDFIKNNNGGLEFTTVNPVAILGPSLDSHISGSFHLLQHLLDGSMKAIPNIQLNVVDVRDVADLHMRAMASPEASGQRFIASADGHISMPEIASLLKLTYPGASQKVSLKRLPNWVLSFASLFNAKAKEGVLLMKMNRNVSNAKAKQLLSWKPVATQEQSILAAVESIIKYKLIDHK
ncbi:SDR family oxidoreductase [Pedobacter sp. AW31-3R]|uniref:SDR family oxidoreductase n=1 Tax=Pedobacter sp. AW31-3R TaxID=3445781 RepID=UPI003F9FC856